MENRISAVIIDPLKKEHDYTQVNTKDTIYYVSYGELGFDLHVINNAKNIMNVLSKHRGFDCLITIGDLLQEDFDILNDLSFEFRKKWIHKEKFEPKDIAESIIRVFLGNINRERLQEVKLYSVFTCTYKTSQAMFNRLYDSLKAQTYKNWNWWILDDSPNDNIAKWIANRNDPRINVIHNISNHGNIGFNKNLICMACDGDYLVEVDHDDELTPDCLESLNEAFTKYPDTDFVYSNCYEEVNGKEVYYGNPEDFAYGCGSYKKYTIDGVERNIAVTAQVNALTVRGIHACPNHVRCWKTSFYHKIGGHNKELSVLDDLDILIRTFLYGQMTKVNKVLYIQHEGNSGAHGRGQTTQTARFKEIQRSNELLRIKYDKQIHDRIIELGETDYFWVEEWQQSDIHNMEFRKNIPKLKNFNHNI